MERVEPSAEKRRDEYEAFAGTEHASSSHPTTSTSGPGFDRVTERNDRYWVVEKTGHASELAKRADPRSVPLAMRRCHGMGPVRFERTTKRL